MSRSPSTLLTPVLILIALSIATAGCSSTPVAEPQGNGTLHASSVPPGAEVYLDGEYYCPTPCALSDVVPAGRHTVEFRMSGYESVMYPVTVVNGGMAGVSATLVSTQVTLPVTSATTTVPAAGEDLPEIHVDGYWTYPQGRSSTSNPVPLVVHMEAFNVGTADAREVTASANFYYGGRMVCWNTVYLGTLAAGGHVSRDTMVSCTLPSQLSDPDLEVRFENVAVTQV